MKVQIIPAGPLKANCYVIETSNKNAVAIDIGGDTKLILDYLEDNNLTLKKILLTHGHYDHIGGVDEIKEKTGAELFIHSDDAELISDAYKNLSTAMGFNTSVHSEYSTISDGDIISEDGIDFKVMHTPGHSMGSVCYIANDCIFSGDTLFRASIGRTDFAGSSPVMMKKSLEKIKALTGDYTIYPGHGEASSLSFELKYNPYL